MAKADVFQKNKITVGIKLVKIRKKIDNIDIIKSRGVNEDTWRIGIIVQDLLAISCLTQAGWVKWLIANNCQTMMPIL